MKNKSRLIRKEKFDINSTFSVEASFINDVFDTEGNRLKFIFNTKEYKLSVVGDYNEIEILYSNIEKV